MLVKAGPPESKPEQLLRLLPVRLLILAMVLALASCGREARRSAAMTLDQGGFERLRPDYIRSYFDIFPTAGLAAGHQQYSWRLEILDESTVESWLARARITTRYLEGAEHSEVLEPDDRLDAYLMRRHAQQAIFDLETRQEHRRNPLFWTRRIGNATVFLLAREDQSLERRLSAVRARTRLLPRLIRQARAALESPTVDEISPELFEIAARQMQGSVHFYREGLALLADENSERREPLQKAGEAAAEAIEELIVFLDERGAEATGSPRLGDHYATAFRLYTGLDTPPEEVLEQARQALREKVEEAASYGRSVWSELMNGSPPVDDAAVLRELFARVAKDRASDVDDFEQQYRDLIDRAIEFTRDNDVVSLPEELTLVTLRSPDFFVGQSVGGVYSAGPYAPDADTLFYLPVPSSSATPEQRDAFFRDFNNHFNVMIVPHEIVPGHYLQLKLAARNESKVRALMGDDVFIEGWGTFCERLMLDLGWGDSLDRLAHLKKQLENIARTIVDIRVHTEGMSRDEVLEFVQKEAFQDRQFAANMWSRSITTAPQLVSYWLGYRSVMGLYEDVRKERGDAFVLKEFMDAMMADGPVPVSHYRERLLGNEG